MFHYSLLIISLSYLGCSHAYESMTTDATCSAPFTTGVPATNDTVWLKIAGDALVE